MNSIVSKNKNNTRVGETVNLTLNTSDNLAGVKTATALLKYPDDTVVSYNLTLSGTIFNLTLSGLTLIGDYDVNYTLNDSAQNSVNATDYFDVYTVNNISGSITDASGNARNDTYLFFRPNTRNELYNFLFRFFRLHQILQKLFLDFPTLLSRIQLSLFAFLNTNQDMECDFL